MVHEHSYTQTAGRNTDCKRGKPESGGGCGGPCEETVDGYVEVGTEHADGHEEEREESSSCGAVGKDLKWHDGLTS